MDIPPAALTIFSKLPASMQEKLQTFLMKAMQDPYLFPLATIPAALQLAYVPHFLKFGLMVVNKGLDYNNEAPRTEKLEQYKMFPGMMTRATAAHLNALEMFPFYAVAVLMCKVQKVNAALVTPLCIRYLVLRVAYTVLYIFGVNKFVALVRTLSWGAMMSLVMELSTLGL